MKLNTESIDISIDDLTSDVLAEYEIIDIRRPEAAALEPIHLFEHQNIPARTLLEEHDFMDPAKGYILTCYHGKDSRYLAMMFRQMGFPNCFSLQKGYSAIQAKQNKTAF